MKWWWVSAVAVAAMVTLAVSWWMPGDPVGPSVNDLANLLTERDDARIVNYNGKLLKIFDIDLRLVTVKGTEDIDRYAETEFDRRKVGFLSTKNRGLLLVVNPDTDQVRLEVGYAIETIFTDVFVSYIERQQMVPFFRSGRIADGILATTELIVERANKATKALAWPETKMQGSGGGGARTRAKIGTRAQQTYVWKSDIKAVAGGTPVETLDAYLSAMAKHQSSAELPIYTEETQGMLRSWTVTPAQMDNVVKSIRNCPKDAVRINKGARLAVIRYPIKSRKCSPYFFRHVGGSWRLDLATQQKHIRFSIRNHWRFVSGPPAEFAFAFKDWEFNRLGFPH